MAKTSIKDEYTNRTIIALEKTAGAGGAIAAVPSAFDESDKVGILIRRFEVHFDYDNTMDIDTDNDRAYWGLSFTGTVPALNYFGPEDTGYLCSVGLEVIYVGTPANCILFEHPIVKDLTWMKNGGLLVHPTALYVWIATQTGWGASLDSVFVIYYDKVSLTDTMYQELMQVQIFTSKLA